jgi:hypothetical protein
MEVKLGRQECESKRMEEGAMASSKISFNNGPATSGRLTKSMEGDPTSIDAGSESSLALCTRVLRWVPPDVDAWMDVDGWMEIHV